MIDMEKKYLDRIKSILREHVPEITVWAFGSRVSGTARKYSDLDLVLVTEEPLPPGKIFELKDAFSASDIPYLVDIVDWSATSDEFKEIIKSGYEVLQDKG